ncbi:hypothetical protein ES676_02580 [Bizionia saleffrena]|uniref:Uncharacterized protein n=1 Tax=Bizionia saleffrena TaxID=291189 RepID=A0A8H2LPF1_9FLAO|nr:hypothetical protein [Bizionia saleffrena]TYB78115.1 hypothetical protein ES676_02580 [Bizionia saleffrena]
MVNRGFIMLRRELVDWEWYTDLNTCKVFLHCLVKVNYSSKKWQGVVIEKGEFITSYEKLATETGLTISKVRTALSKLELTKTIAVETTTIYTKIAILSLNDFVAEVDSASNDKPNSTRFDKRLTNDSHTIDNQLATTNTNNNIITNRKKIFREKVFALTKFNIKILESFFNYWSELNTEKTKMRFETEQFFEIEKRLNKWKANERITINRYKLDAELQTNRKSA